MVDIDFLKEVFFTFDKPTPYTLKQKTIYIYPVMLPQSEIYTRNIGILDINKNDCNDVQIIQMSYLEYLYWLTKADEHIKECLNTIFLMCLKIDTWSFGKNENGKIVIVDHTHNCSIDKKSFDDIRKIILYQNNPSYDDSYISPDIKEMMIKVDSIKNFGMEVPSLERKMAIITAHTGLNKTQQSEMTLRAHQLLFNEVVGEVEFTTTRPVALFAGSGGKMEHWIFPHKKNKMDGYLTTVGKYKNSFGGDGSINMSDSNNLSDTEMLLKQHNL